MRSSAPSPDAGPPRLLGSYATPRFRYGAGVVCQARGEVEIVGLTDARIPWPIGKRGRHKAIVLYKDLVKAVRRESSLAIQHWFGVGYTTVWQWRKALGVGFATEGTSGLLSEISQTNPSIIAGLKKAHGKARDPERCAQDRSCSAGQGAAARCAASRVGCEPRAEPYGRGTGEDERLSSPPGNQTAESRTALDGC